MPDLNDNQVCAQILGLLQQILSRIHDPTGPRGPLDADDREKLRAVLDELKKI